MHPSRIVAIILVALTGIAALLSPDAFVVILGGAVLAVGILLLWTPNSVPILLLPFLLQWLPIGLKPIESAITGKPLQDLTMLSVDLDSTARFAFLGLMAFTVGMRISSLGSRTNQSWQLSSDAEQWPQSGITTLALTLIGTGHLIGLGHGHFGGLNETMSNLSNVSYCGLFMLLYWSLKERRSQKLAITIVVFELVFGMTGFFGEFRTTLFVVTLALICAQRKINLRWLITAGVLGAASLVTMVFWTAIKPDYRSFLNEGQHFQGTNRPISERLQYLSERVTSFDATEFDTGFSSLVDRASYIDFLGAVREFVPSNSPFEGGTRTLAGVKHVFTPRIFFPEKPPLESDTEVTSRYTGISFNNYTYVSISIGYFGELYIDFGEIGTLFFLMFFGLLLGIGCRLVLSYPGTPMILNVGLGLMLTLPFWYFEQALVKVIGSMVMTTFIVLGLQRVVFGSMLPDVLARLRLPRAPQLVPPSAEA